MMTATQEISASVNVSERHDSATGASARIPWSLSPAARRRAP
jgi:hypothetical protein